MFSNAVAAETHGGHAARTHMPSIGVIDVIDQVVIQTRASVCRQFLAARSLHPTNASGTGTATAATSYQ